MYTPNDLYRRIYLAVMEIESGARKLGISVKEIIAGMSKQALIQAESINHV